MLIVAAMSGGVDSSVAAALVKADGADVLGVSLRMHGCDLDPAYACRCDPQETRRVAEAIGIPHEVVDARAEFTTRVVQPARDEQARGRTPNPCVTCNQQVKFGLLLEWAVERGADALVTGHYARRQGTRLLAGRDRSKDQSYFLFTLAGDARLHRVGFPVGEMLKSEVRAEASRRGLPVARREESQDLCFPVRDRDSDRPGDIVDADGKVLGTHDGLSGYTVGQRRGIGVPAPARLYVLALDRERNRVVVGPGEALERHEVTAEIAAWAGPAGERHAQVKVRYRQDPVPARVRISAGRIEACLERPVRAVTPGQALVCYDGELVLGGGWIV
jgi:tRNA-specific 2-thiouridylase